MSGVGPDATQSAAAFFAPSPLSQAASKAQEQDAAATLGRRSPSPSLDLRIAAQALLHPSAPPTMTANTTPTTPRNEDSPSKQLASPRSSASTIEVRQAPAESDARQQRSAAPTSAAVSPRSASPGTERWPLRGTYSAQLCYNSRISVAAAAIASRPAVALVRDFVIFTRRCFTIFHRRPHAGEWLRPVRRRYRRRSRSSGTRRQPRALRQHPFCAAQLGHRCPAILQPGFEPCAHGRGVPRLSAHHGLAAAGNGRRPAGRRPVAIPAVGEPSPAGGDAGVAGGRGVAAQHVGAAGPRGAAQRAQQPERPGPFGEPVAAQHRPSAGRRSPAGPVDRGIRADAGDGASRPCERAAIGLLHSAGTMPCQFDPRNCRTNQGCTQRSARLLLASTPSSPLHSAAGRFETNATQQDNSAVNRHALCPRPFRSCLTSRTRPGGWRRSCRPAWAAKWRWRSRRRTRTRRRSGCPATTTACGERTAARQRRRKRSRSCR